MPESLRTRMTRLLYNFFPAYRGTGARVTYIADDFREVRVKLPLSWRTYNYVGTIYGGSMYASVDPMFMIMLIKNLGPEYVVWDKEATVRFRRPGQSTLTARFTIEPSDLDEIRQTLEAERSVDRSYHVELIDREGRVCAEVDKVIYIRKARGQEQRAGLRLWE
ncbi:MAG: DUF4442 domain-containing protein [Candidatus Lernaella stagnicola]|nr:DUF4442 domain-containing protein [Candidatus Lernaella stagnicola]